MLGALLLSIIPTLIAVILINKSGIKIKSGYLKISLSWFTGQYIFTTITFLVAVIFSLFVSDLLFKASLILITLLILVLIFLHKSIYNILKRTYLHTKKGVKLKDIILICSCFLFSCLFFIPHLAYQNNGIYQSPIYWDFHWHASLIQNFVLGDNFPPQNEAFAGVPHTYHYFWAILTGIYVSFGLNLVDAINFFSISTFFFILITLIGLGEEFFGKKYVGFITIILALTSSSLHFIDYFYKFKNLNILEILNNIFLNTQHPWFASFSNIKHSFYYNGTFFNLFYFIEERQIIIGILYLLLSIFIIYKRNNLSYQVLFLIGLLMGGFFLWHLHITITVLLALLFILIFDRDRKKTLVMLSSFIIIFLLHIIYIKGITQSPWFMDVKGFPKINPGFSDQEYKQFSFLHAYKWYIYSYGLKLILLPLSLFFIRIKDKKLFLLFCSIILPTFILLNTVQLSPGSVYENHKWLRPINFIIDLAVAYGICHFFFGKKKLLQLFSGVIVMLLLTMSGIIELSPFMNSRPTRLYAHYPSKMSEAINSKSAKSHTFVGEDDYEIQLTGRKVFLGDVLGGGLGLDRKKRKEIITDIYDAPDMDSFCSLTKKYKIDFIQYNNDDYVLPEYLTDASYFQTINSKTEKIIFVDTKKSCKD